METHKVRRLPVVDKGKLVGVVTLDRIVGVGPSPATSLSVWEINYLLAKMKVREVMQKDVVSVGPDVSVEQALARAQAMKVGAAPVVEDGKVVGIITTNDFMLKLLNPALGIGKLNKYPRLQVSLGNDQLPIFLGTLTHPLDRASDSFEQSVVNPNVHVFLTCSPSGPSWGRTDRSLFWEINSPEVRSLATGSHGGTIVPSCWRTKQNTPEFRNTVDDELPVGSRAVASSRSVPGSLAVSVGGGRLMDGSSDGATIDATRRLRDTSEAIYRARMSLAQGLCRNVLALAGRWPSFGGSGSSRSRS
jgi:hypothetical protein